MKIRCVSDEISYWEKEMKSLGMEDNFDYLIQEEVQRVMRKAKKEKLFSKIKRILKRR